jgi:hypothetical protein
MLGALGPIAMRCLQKDPHDRYASMAEVVAAVEQALADAAGPRPKARKRSFGGRPRPDVDEAVSTPMLHPMAGPLGIGLGMLGVALVIFLVVHELRSQPVEAAQPSGSATATAPAASTASLPVADTSGAAAGTTARPPSSAAVPVGGPPTPPGSAPRADDPIAATARPRSSASHPPRSVDLPRKGGGSGDVVDPWRSK